MKDKKAISDVVATVLIILITVAAVAIVWAAVIPMIQKPLAQTGCPNAQTDIQIVTTEGRTCVVQGPATSNVKIQVSRGAGDYQLSAVQVIPSVGGSSANATTETAFPPKNGEQTYEIDGVIGNATSVAIAPMVLVGVANQTCAQSQQVALQPC